MHIVCGAVEGQNIADGQEVQQNGGGLRVAWNGAQCTEREIDQLCCCTINRSCKTVAQLRQARGRTAAAAEGGGSINSSLAPLGSSLASGATRPCRRKVRTRQGGTRAHLEM